MNGPERLSRLGFVASALVVAGILAGAAYLLCVHQVTVTNASVDALERVEIESGGERRFVENVPANAPERYVRFVGRTPVTVTVNVTVAGRVVPLGTCELEPGVRLRTRIVLIHSVSPPILECAALN